MPMKIADVAPEEAQFIDISERLSELLSATPPCLTAVPVKALGKAFPTRLTASKRVSQEVGCFIRIVLPTYNRTEGANSSR